MNEEIAVSIYICVSVGKSNLCGLSNIFVDNFLCRPVIHVNELAVWKKVVSVISYWPKVCRWVSSTCISDIQAIS